MTSVERLLKNKAPAEKWRPFLTLFKKEILRFCAVLGQTLLAPVVSGVLYLLVFGVSLGSKISLVPGITYIQFVVPGLILMGVINNSFANSSSSFFISKYFGNLADLLVTPLSPAAFVGAYGLAALTRGLMVGTAVLLISLCFTPLPFVHPVLAVLAIMLSSLCFGFLGLIAAVGSNSFDVLSIYTSFVILPLTYLGGLFYPVSMLPSPWNQISKLNPLHYQIEAFRGSLTGIADTSLGASIGATGAMCVIFAIIAHTLLKKGYKTRS